MKSWVPCGGTWLLLGAGALLLFSGCGKPSIAEPGFDDTPHWYGHNVNQYAVVYPDGRMNLWLNVKTSCQQKAYPYTATGKYRYCLVFNGTLDQPALCDSVLENCQVSSVQLTVTADSTLRGRLVTYLTVDPCGSWPDTLDFILQGGTP